MKEFLRNYILVTLALVCAAVAPSAWAVNILFAHVDTGSYVDDGNEIAAFLTDAGHTVTEVFLQTTVVSDFSSYDQVWVYDLSTGLDNSATQTTNYTNISSWYNGLTDQNLIVDGRIISSGPDWISGGESDWIQNYAEQLLLRGGGLVLGTDHQGPTPGSAFVEGINEINASIGIGDFTGNYFVPPLEALVDPLSPLWVSTLNACSSSPTDDCINDNSSTSFAPTGLQTNGQFLTPVAYHGTASQAFEFAAVASTIGSDTFGTGECGGPDQDPCPTPIPGTIPLLGLGVALLGFIRAKKYQM